MQVAACQATIFARGHVDDERHVVEPRPRAAIGEVHDPRAVRDTSGEVPVQQIPGPRAVLARDRGAHALGTADPVQSQRSHGPVHRPRRGGRNAPLDQGGYLPAAVEPFGGEPANPGQRPISVNRPGGIPYGVHHVGVADRAIRDMLTGTGPRPVGPCGDLAALL